MSARDVIATAPGINGTWSGKAKADLILEALAAAGYSILRDDETHAPTVERCAKVAESMPDWKQPREAATAIRALIKEGGE